MPAVNGYNPALFGFCRCRCYVLKSWILSSTISFTWTREGLDSSHFSPGKVFPGFCFFKTPLKGSLFAHLGKWGWIDNERNKGRKRNSYKQISPLTSSRHLVVVVVWPLSTISNLQYFPNTPFFFIKQHSKNHWTNLNNSLSHWTRLN